MTSSDYDPQSWQHKSPACSEFGAQLGVNRCPNCDNKE